MRPAAWLLCLCLTGIGAQPLAGEETARLGVTDLRIEVSGVKSPHGVIQYAIFNSPDHFPSREGRIAKGEVPAVSPATTIVVKGLARGNYAVAIFHDANLNDAFDQGLFGIPLEDYGFSNDARGFFSAPDFKNARFAVGGPSARISITIGR